MLSSKYLFAISRQMYFEKYLPHAQQGWHLNFLCKYLELGQNVLCITFVNVAIDNSDLNLKQIITSNTLHSLYFYNFSKTLLEQITEQAQHTVLRIRLVLVFMPTDVAVLFLFMF